MAQKIYTRTGDAGETSLLGGLRVPKHHLRIEAYGTVDELNAHLGLVRDLCADSETVETLGKIQDFLFHIGSHLALDPQSKSITLQDLRLEEITHLETEMNRMSALLKPMTHFILPGGHPSVSHLHIARCICRRAERAVLRLHELEPLASNLIKFLNRLSDYLFVLSRYTAHLLGISERLWIPKA